MSKVLIIGGSHFIGGHLGDFLVKSKYKVDVVSKVKHSFEGYNRTIVCNRKNKEELAKYIKGEKYDIIFDVNAYDYEDVDIIADLIDRDYLKKYIILTGAAVYKPTSQKSKEDYEKGLNENWGSMGMRKLGIEKYMEESDIPYIILRPTYIYGDNNSMYREFYFFDKIIAGETIPIPGGKKVNNQFIYIKDLVKVLASIIRSDKVREAYNVTNPQQITWDEMLETCGEIIGKKPKIKYVDMNKVDFRERTFFPFRNIDFSVDIDKLIEDGLYIPNTSLDEGLEKTFIWYQENKPEITDKKMVNIEKAVNS